MNQCCQQNSRNNKEDLTEAFAAIEEIIRRHVIYPPFYEDAKKKLERLRELIGLKDDDGTGLYRDSKEQNAAILD